VLYVWFDALTNYLTGTGWPDRPADAASFWPADVHIIGRVESITFGSDPAV